jgi:hypothetical protein
MTSPPHDASRPAARAPQPVRHGHPAVLTFGLDSPYQGFRWGYRCPSGALTAPGSWSVHGRCATDGRRGTNLLAGHRSAHRVTAGMRSLRGERAGGGLRTGRAPGAGEATSAYAPARPLLVNSRRRGGTASTRPARTAPLPRAESADTSLTARPATRVRPAPAARSALSLTIFRLPRVRSGGQGGLRRARGPARFTRGKAIIGMTSLVSKRSTRQPPRTVTRQVTRPPRPSDTSAAPGRAVGAGQRLNIPAGVNRG